MAEKLAQRLHDNFLQCSICSEKLNNPRMLPCVHTFCLRCLVQWEDSIRGQDFRCPFCQSTVELPEGGVRGLPANFILANLMEELQHAESRPDGVSPVCGFCKREDGELFCIDCKLYLCKSCEETHNRLPGFLDHTVIKSDKLSDENYMKRVISSKAPHCSAHPHEVIRFFCNTCQLLICRDCTILKHNGHQCMEVKNRALDVKSEIEVLQKQSRKQSELLDTLENRLSFNIAATRNRIESCKREINETYEKLTRRLQSDKEKLMDNVENIDGRIRQAEMDFITSMREWRQNNEDNRAAIGEVLENDNHWGMIEMMKGLPSKFQELSRSGKDLHSKARRIDEQLERACPALPSTKLALVSGKSGRLVGADDNMIGGLSCDALPVLRYVIPGWK